MFSVRPTGRAGSRERVGIEWLVAEFATTYAAPLTEHDLETLATRIGALAGEAFADDVAILAVSVDGERL